MFWRWPKPVERGMDSTDTNVDLELLAALIDGRLSGEERARAVKLVANSDEALELVANTLREHGTSDASVVPITSARRWRHWKVIVPVAAAAALAVVMVPRLTGPSTRGVLASEYATELARDPRFAGALRNGWDQRGWRVTRGGNGSREGSAAARVGSPVESRLAFRLGVRSVDLRIALGRGDTSLAGHVAGEVIETLTGIGFSEPVAARYTELKSRLATETVSGSIEKATTAERDLRDLLVSPAFSFGEWVAAADLAAQARDTSFFHSPHGIQFIRSTMPSGSFSAEDTEALRSIDVSINGGLTDRALDDVHTVLQTVIRRRGS